MNLTNYPKQVLAFALLLALMATPSYAQNFDWVKDYPVSYNSSSNPSRYETGDKIAVDQLGNIYVVSNWKAIEKYAPNGHLIWSKTFMDGTFSDRSSEISVDNNGNIIVTGYFENTINFDPNTNPITITSNGNQDVFVLKMATNGAILWVKTFGGTSNDRSTCVDTDANGNIFVSGLYESPFLDIDPNASTFTLTRLGSKDGFIQKLDPNGNFLWGNSIGDYHSYDEAGFIKIDHQGNVIVSGRFGGTVDFDPGPAVVNANPSPSSAWFMLKLDNNGNFIWVKSWDISSFVVATIYSIDVDHNNNIYATGRYISSLDVDPGPGVHTVTSNGNCDNLIFRLDANGDFAWAKSFGYTTPNWTSEGSYSIHVDNQGYVYTTGSYEDTVDFNPGGSPYMLIGPYPGSRLANIFIYKLDTSGTFIWAHTLPNTGPTYSSSFGHGILTDHLNNIYVTGRAKEHIDFDPSSNVNTSTSTARRHFLVKYNQDSCSNILFFADSTRDLGCPLIQGYASAKTLNALPPIHYTWSTGSTASSIQTNTSGIYSVTMTDANSCTRSSSVLINGPHSLFGQDLLANMISRGFQTGFPSQIQLDAGNLGCMPTTGQVKLVLDDFFLFDSASVAPDHIIGDTLFWNFSNLSYTSTPFSPTIFGTVSTSAALGDFLCFDLCITPIAGDLDSSNNIRQYCFPVTNAYDPNDKQVYPQGICQPHYTLKDNKLTYKIRFQNTGNASAVNVYILDSLDANLDVNTLQIISKSHPMLITEILPNNVLKFRFDNIYLPDSFSNESASHGYVIFEIAPNATIPHQTLVENKVGIYFDYNAAVYTNTVFNTIVDSLPYTEETLTQSSCDSVVINNQTYTMSGSYVQHLTSIAGCDSTLFLNLTINNSKTTFLNETACDSFTINGQTYNSSGNYIQYISTVAGCDSLINLNLNLNTSTSTSITHAACNSYTLNGQTYTTSGIYYQNFIAANGCDSILILDLTISNSSNTTINQISCDSFVLNGQTYTSSGHYTQILSNTQGCDSVITLNLTIFSNNSNIVNLSGCNSIVFNGQTYTTTGSYQQNLSNANGCDSLVTINVDILSTTDSLSVQTCHSYTLNGQTYTTSGQYTQTLINAVGCDSILVLDLVIREYTTDTLTIDACENYIVNNNLYTQSGSYIQTLSNQFGCDSILVLHLTITSSDAGFYSRNDTLIANTQGGIYQWLDCNNNMMPIAGATNAVFVPSQNGSYALAYRLNNCTDTSACFNHVISSQKLLDNNISWQLFPSPTTGKVYIRSTTRILDVQIRILDQLGRILLQKEYKHLPTEIDLSSYPTGVYYLSILHQEKQQIEKIIKQ